MKPGIFLLTTVALLLCLAGTGAAIEVAEAVVCRDIQDKQPVEAGNAFPADVGRVWCWSKISGGENSSIRHVYYYKDAEMASIELPVRSSPFRTYSSKRILPAQTGPWRVEIKDSAGNLLQSLPFTIGEEGGAQETEPPVQQQ